MHVFVTGAGGFIGSHVVRTLVARGHTVTGLVHRAGAGGLGSEVRTVVGDVTHRESFEPAAKDVDGIVNLALPGVETRFREAYPVWKAGTANLLALAVERSMKAYVSASGVFGMYRHDRGAWIDEAAPETPATRYTRGRAEADALVRAAHRDHGLAITILRSVNVYGRGGPFGKFFLDYMRAGRYRVVGDGSNYTGFVHVEDCALAYAMAVETSSGSETFLVADDRPITLRDASDAIADALQVRHPKAVPPFLASLVVGRDAIALITESARVRNEKVKGALGWSPTYPTLRDGLPSVVR